MPDRWKRLGTYVRRERHRRRQTQADFARTIGISTRSVGSLERGESTRYDADTLAAVEDALAWEPGSIEAFIAGRPPRTTDKHLAEIHAAWPHLSNDARAILAEIARKVADESGR